MCLFVSCFCLTLFLLYAYHCKKKSGYWDNKIHIWKIAQPLFWLGCLWGHLFSVVIHLCWVLLLLHYIKSTTSFTFLQWNSTLCSGRPEAPEDAFSFPVASQPLADPAYLSCVQSLCSWPIPMVDSCFCFLFLIYSLQGFVECLHTLRFSR